MQFNPTTVGELISAFITADITTGPHTIDLVPGKTYEFTSQYSNDCALPPLFGGEDITVNGNGAAFFRNSVSSFRFFWMGDGTQLRLNNLTLANGGYGSASGTLGGAIFVASGDLYLDRVEFSGNSARVGGAIYSYSPAQSTKIISSSCTFVGNNASDSSGQGGAIAAFDETTLTIRDSLFSVNGGQTGGAIFYNTQTNSDLVLIENTSFSNNIATSSGGAIYGTNGNSTIVKCRFIKNQASNGGALFVSESVMHVNQSTQFDRNTASGNGGAVYVSTNGTLDAEGNHFIGNKSSGSAGGVFVSWVATGSNKVRYCTFSGNENYAVEQQYSGFPPKLTDARDNLWNGIGGASGAGSGVGDQVSSYVYYLPHQDADQPATHEGSSNGCGSGSDAETSGNPISLRLGEKRVHAVDIQFMTATGNLAFERRYRQSQLGINSDLGLGWLHNHAVTLTPPVGNVIVVRYPTGTQQFSYNTVSARYEGQAGATSFIEYNASSSEYILTEVDGATHRFDSAGVLLERMWLTGMIWQYFYTGGKLTQVSTPFGRQIQFVYYSGLTGSDAFKNDQLWRVGDHATVNLGGTPSGRYVEFDYVPEKLNGVVITNPNPLLSSVRDVRGQMWTYDYYGQQLGESDADLANFLTQRQSPMLDTDGDTIADSVLTLESLSYTLTVQGHIDTIQQVRGAGALTTDYAFGIPVSGNTTKTTETVTGTNQPITYYYEKGIYTGAEDPNAAKTDQGVNNQYHKALISDPNENTTLMSWSDDGKHLNQVVDALGHTTGFEYDTADRLTKTTDAESRDTQYTYGDSNNPRQPTVIQQIDNDGVSVIRWQQFTYDSYGHTTEELLLDPADASGNTLLQRTTYVYGTSGNENGLLESMTTHDLVDPSNNTSVTYTYDSVGRVIRTQKTSLFSTCKFNFTVYDEAGNVMVSACSTHNVTGDVTEANIDALRATYPVDTTVTKHQYDAMGRRIQTTSDAGTSYARTNVTLYDGLDRVARTINHYVDGGYAAPASWVFEGGVWKDDVGGTVISHGVDQDENIISDTSYNARGQVRLTQDVFGVTTLYGYDLADRLVKTIVNASNPTYDNDHITGDPDLSAYAVSGNAEQDMITEQSYDLVGNLVQSVDTRGMNSFTVYDALN
ncbi:MAG: DUF6531 domain-containing protein, partial [Chloroflexota bacterium]